MSLKRKVAPEATIGVGITEDPEGLSAIHQAGCAAAIWRRTPLPQFQSWIDELAPEQLPNKRLILRPDRVRETVLEILKTHGVSQCPESEMLSDDIAALSHLFAEVMDTPYIRLRLDVVTTNACRKFHIDAVTARLICTYRGPGTQYGISTDGADPQRVFSVPTGAPIVLRGTLWPEDPQYGLLHRSPPIVGTGETRLLLVLDPVQAAVDADDHPIFH